MVLFNMKLRSITQCDHCETTFVLSWTESSGFTSNKYTKYYCPTCNSHCGAVITDHDIPKIESIEELQSYQKQAKVHNEEVLVSYYPYHTSKH